MIECVLCNKRMSLSSPASLEIIRGCGGKTFAILLAPVNATKLIKQLYALGKQLHTQTNTSIICVAYNLLSH